MQYRNKFNRLETLSKMHMYDMLKIDRIVFEIVTGCFKSPSAGLLSVSNTRGLIGLQTTEVCTVTSNLEVIFQVETKYQLLLPIQTSSTNYNLKYHVRTSSTCTMNSLNNLSDTV